MKATQTTGQRPREHAMQWRCVWEAMRGWNVDMTLWHTTASFVTCCQAVKYASQAKTGTPAAYPVFNLCLPALMRFVEWCMK
jgi:hypothetical protein